MSFPRNLYTSLCESVCLLLCYTLIISPIIPFPSVRVEAASSVAATKAGAAIQNSPSPNAIKTQASENEWRDRELLVHFNEHAPDAKVSVLLKENGARSNGKLRGGSGVEKLRLAAGADPETIATVLRSSPLIDFAEPNYLITADQTATQSSSSDQTRNPDQWALGAIGAERAWESSTGSKQTVIAVIDSGIDFSHRDLAGNEWINSHERLNKLDDDGDDYSDDLRGWDFVNDSEVIADELGHGTAVAGIISAEGDKGAGIKGIMWRASIMNLRVLDRTGIGDIATAVEAFDYASTKGAQVINCSWGTNHQSIALREAIERARMRGVVVVASAGNDGRDNEISAHYPASFELPNLISVAATDKDDSLAPFSNMGSAHVSLAAPGANVLTAKAGGEYQFISGTSASTAHVAGVAGLVKTLRPWLSAELTLELILRGARRIPALADKVVAKGMVSAAGAINALNALPANEGLNERADYNGGEHGKDSTARSFNAGDYPVDSSHDGHEFRVTPPARKHGVPGTGLPDLDELRSKQPVMPQTPVAIPSTRCAHHNPQCTKDKEKNKASVDYPAELLAWNPFGPSNNSFFHGSSSLLSDSPFRLFRQTTASTARALPLQTGRINVALSSNGAVASASSSYSASYPASAAINGERKGVPPTNGGLWHSIAPGNTFPDWLQVDFSGLKTIDEVDVFTNQDNWAYPIEPTEALTFGLYGLTGYDVQYWNGSAWVTMPGASVSGNNRVWRKFTFTPITTNRIRVLANSSPDGYSRITELEAYGTDPSYRVNVAHSLNGGTASASATYSPGPYTADKANNGDRRGLGGEMWHDAAPAYSFPDWLQISFNGSKTIDEVDVFTIQDNYLSPTEPTEATSFNLYGLTGYEVQYWNGMSWASIPGASVYGNNKVWRKFSFTALTTTKIRVLTTASVDGYSRITEVEAYGTNATGATDTDYARARLEPGNRTGQSDVDLLSRNANWSMPILGLKGRAGLDLGLSLSYNTLVWTKSLDGKSVKFDADRGTPSPGFRLGLPTIQAPYYNSSRGQNAYLLINASGGHTELLQTTDPLVFESTDSSYLQLTIDGSSLTLRPTDGSQLTYAPFNGQYLCTGIKDRNGNYISISYHTDGRLNTITDTLARVVAFNYDAYLNLNSITQNWGGTTHTWATFDWSDLRLQPGFASSIAVAGPQNNSIIPVLSSVRMADGTYFKFDYNSWGQIIKVTTYAADSQQNGLMTDSHPLNYTAYVMDAGTGLTDCPRVKEKRVWAEHWNNENSVPAEALTRYSTATDYSWGQMVLPDETIYKEFFETAPNWQKGLTTRTEIWSDGSRMKQTATAYTQNNPDSPYRNNPRITETTIQDSEGNLKRTRIEYGTQGSDNEKWGLPSRVIEYAADGATEIRHTFTGYNLDPVYTSRRIIGLVSATHVSDTRNWQSIVYYSYDADGAQLIATTTPTIQHDDLSYSAASHARGNLTAVTRYDVSDINNAGKRAVTQFGYDTNGSIIFTKDPLDHKSNVVYADSFNDNTNHNTYAYPTKVTPPLAPVEDAESFSTTKQYNYSTGAVTRMQGPVPGGHTQGPVQLLTYDTVGRLSQISSPANNAYQRWVYDPAGHITSFTTVEAGAEETLSTTVFDGLGRVRSISSDNPNSVGGYSGQFKRYDRMGRVSARSNPTEITHSWAEAGDDAAAGWVYTQQAYDWNGRPTTTVNPDGTTRELSYGGCGCAGGEVVLVRDEMGRRQRVTSDVLGRTRKTEILNWDGTVYSTTANSYNSLDHITNVKQYQGTEASDVYQESVMTYDGFGRLQTSKAPEQVAPTSYTYNLDGTTATATDARGATSTFSYNQRHLATGISYYAPAGVSATPSVSYSYDAAGNRTGMTDALGSVSYQYDQLSRMTSETRNFNGIGSFTLSYGYNLAGKLTSITDPFGARVGYNYDRTGRLSGVTGTGFGNVSEYATNIQYRAWNALKRFSFGSGDNLQAVTYDYNPRLQIERLEFRLTNHNNALLQGVEYQYNGDGQVRYSHELTNAMQDRAYGYDHMGRFTRALTGEEARGEPITNPGEIPFNQVYGFDVWGNLNSRKGQLWGQNVAPLSATYVNGRNTNWTYDPAGNIKQEGTRLYGYDAAGRSVSASEPPIRTGRPGLNVTQQYDGDGLRVKRTENGVSKYELRSTALGGATVTDLNGQGGKLIGYVYANGRLLAKQTQLDGAVTWVHQSPDGSGEWESYSYAIGTTRTVELDPLLNDVGTANPSEFSGVGGDGRSYPRYGDPTGPDACTLGYDIMPCAYVMKVVRRDFPQALMLTTTSRIGAPVTDPRATTVYDGKSILLSQNLGAAVPGGASVTVTWGPEILRVETVGYSMSWAELRPTQQLSIFQQNPERALTKNEVEMIRQTLRGLLTDKCKRFINDLFKAAGSSSSTDILNGFDEVDDASKTGKGGFFFKYDQIGTTIDGQPFYANGTATGKASLGNGRVNLNPGQFSRLDLGFNAIYAAATALHETIHAITNIEDRGLAVAFSTMPGSNPNLLPADKNDVAANSKYWGDGLRAACLPKGF